MYTVNTSGRFVGDWPRIGIRPAVDGRMHGVRESLEVQTRNMALRTAELISANLRYPDGSPVACVVPDHNIGGVYEAAKVAELFRTEGVGVSITITPCWCYGSETMDMDPLTPKAVWGFNGTERPGAVYLAAVLAAHTQKGLPAFGIYGRDVQDAGDGTIPDDVGAKILRFARAGLATAILRGKSYLSLGGVSMGIAGSIVDQPFFEKYLGSQTACDTWLKIWEAVKFRHKPEFRNLDYLDEQYNRSFFIRNFCQDLEHELHNAGVENKTYFEKRINYCREFLDYFPAEDELIVHNTKRAIAESYLMLDNYEQAESEYERLVNDYPDNPWGYVGWGDMYFYNRKKDYARAKEFYEKGLAIANDKTDRMALEERLKDLEHAMRTKS